MRKVMFGMAAVMFTLASAVMFSQSSIVSKPATDITAADIQAVLKHADLSKNADQLAKVIDIGPYNVSMNVQHRIKNQVPDPQSAMHSKVTEIYYVLSGSATLATGGTLMDPKPSAYDAKVIKSDPPYGSSTGPGVSGKVAPPFVSRQIGPGDVVFIPPMTNHWFTRIDDHIDYLAFRVDPEHVLPAGYTHSVLKK